MYMYSLCAHELPEGRTLLASSWQETNKIVHWKDENTLILPAIRLPPVYFFKSGPCDHQGRDLYTNHFQPENPFPSKCLMIMSCYAAVFTGENRDDISTNTSTRQSTVSSAILLDIDGS